MTIKELQQAKVELDKDLTKSVNDIINNFYKTNGIIPSGITASIELIEVKIDTEAKPISSHIDITVKSKFNLA
ncbi:hypothetical protein [uncultured Dysgonomonas sp.]|uniref:Uncharacterized protein n=1 Tax=uncultured Dysgonomonas sp. TaxID=206096 RepID=A0A212IXV9_9BACT|nr:hypothetical protein [uncultured Dysgonomonas sp.]SBV92028.1 hypothetical protein KL86DYS1_10499 [uncultured Dysgonomonas sp.]